MQKGASEGWHWDDQDRLFPPLIPSIEKALHLHANTSWALEACVSHQTLEIQGEEGKKTWKENGALVWLLHFVRRENMRTRSAKPSHAWAME